MGNFLEPSLEHAVIDAVDALRKILNYSSQQQLRLGVAVSGGRDSIALLCAAASLRAELNVHLEVAHVDHGLRTASAEDAAFVVRYANSLDLPVQVLKAPPRPARTNMEAWARSVRYRLLEEFRESVGADYILTAHHLQDQVETLLIRMAAARSSMTIARLDTERRLLRPFLSVAREQIEEYVASKSLSFVEDETNQDFSLLRSRVRHRLLPVLQEVFGEGALVRFATVASRLNEDEVALRAVSQQLLELSQGEPVESLAKDQCRSLQYRSLQWRNLRAKALAELGTPAALIGRGRWEELADAIAAGHLGRFELGHAVQVEVRYGQLTFSGFQSLPRSEETFAAIPLAIPGQVVLPGGVLSARIESRPAMLDTSTQEQVYFSPSILERGPLSVRPRQFGDSVPVFNRGRRALKKLLQEKGIPRFARRYYPVVEQDTEIIWVPLVARGQAFPLTATDENILVLQFKPQD